MSSIARTTLAHAPQVVTRLGTYSTGYTPIREVTKGIMGEDVINQTEEIFPGLDEEGELRGSYRPCGHPGVRVI